MDTEASWAIERDIHLAEICQIDSISSTSLHGFSDGYLECKVEKEL